MSWLLSSVPVFWTVAVEVVQVGKFISLTGATSQQGYSQYGDNQGYNNSSSSYGGQQQQQQSQGKAV